jgi:hypothetical protein
VVAAVGGTGRSPNCRVSSAFIRTGSTTGRSSRWTARRAFFEGGGGARACWERGVSKKRCPSDGGPRVRIHLPPAESLQTFGSSAGERLPASRRPSSPQTGDRGFESVFLHRRVCELLVPKRRSPCADDFGGASNGGGQSQLAKGAELPTYRRRSVYGCSTLPERVRAAASAGLRVRDALAARLHGSGRPPAPQTMSS